MVRIGKREKEIINYLKEKHPKGATARQIAEATNQPISGTWGGIYRILHRLEDKGALWSLKHKGTYTWHVDAIFLIFNMGGI